MGNLAAGIDDRIGFFSAVPEACLVTDAAGNILDANDASDELLRGAGDLAGRSVESFVALEQRHVFRGKLAAALAARRMKFFARLRRADGDLAVELSVAAVRGPQGRVRLFWVLMPRHERPRSGSS
jgi:PAS domain S-box-containing protein